MKSPILVTELFLYKPLTFISLLFFTFSIFLPTPLLETDSVTCLRFAYHMFGYHIDTLRVVKRETSTGGLLTIVWEESGQKGKDWLKGEAEMMLSTTDRVSWLQS